MDFSNTQMKNRKDGGTLLLVSIGFTVISTVGLFIYSLSRGCGYAHSFFLCSGVSFFIYGYLFINVILIILSITQFVKPFFGPKFIKKVLVLYLIMILLVVVFDLLATNIRGTEQDCSLTGLYDKKDSEYCYFKLGQSKNNFDYCDMSGENKDLCYRDVAIKEHDYFLCKQGEYYDGCIYAIALNRFDLAGCGLIQSKYWKDTCINYIQSKSN